MNMAESRELKDRIEALEARVAALESATQALRQIREAALEQAAYVDNRTLRLKKA